MTLHQQHCADLLLEGNYNGPRFSVPNLLNAVYNGTTAANKTDAPRSFFSSFLNFVNGLGNYGCFIQDLLRITWCIVQLF